MLSGIGPAEHLKQHGIKTVADLPVGKNLQDHLAMWIMWARPQNTSPFRDLLRADRISMAFMQAYLTGTGPATIPPSGIAAFTRYNQELTAPEIQFLFRSAPVHPHVWFPGVKPAYEDVFGIRPVLLHPESRGEVLLRSANPRDPIRLVPRFFSAQSDIATLREGYKLGLDAVHQGPLDKYRGKRVDPKPETSRDADIEAWIRTKAITAHHPCATCPMGSDRDAVLDPELRVRGIRAAARDRCLGDAGPDLGQHQRAGADDRGEGCGPCARPQAAARRGGVSAGVRGYAGARRIAPVSGP
jgi:4-pyridoxate dehydrogenase